MEYSEEVSTEISKKDSEEVSSEISKEDSEESTEIEFETLGTDEYNILLYGLIVLICVLIAVLVLYSQRKSRFFGLYHYFSIGHYVYGCCHIFCVLIRVHESSVINFFVFSMPLITILISGIPLIRLYPNAGIEKLLTEKDSAYLIFTFASVCDAIQEFVIKLPLIGGDHLKPALLLNVILLLLSIPSLVFVLVLRSLFSGTNTIPKLVSFFFLVHLSVFLTSDALLMFVEIIVSLTKSYGLSECIILVSRLFAECLWMLFSFNCMPKTANVDMVTV